MTTVKHMITKPQDELDNVSLTSLKLRHDPVWGYVLDATYQIENQSEILEYHIPKIRLNINEHSFKVSKREDPYFGACCWVADVGDGPKELICDNTGNFWTERLIKTKTKEMTLEEIEKKLGHKVKIVNK